MTLLKAKKIKLFDENGDEWKQNKGVVAEDDIGKRFSIVGNDYKVVQHEEVLDTIDETISKLGLRHTKRLVEMNRGGRIRVDITFPDLKIDVGNVNDLVEMKAIYHNSYDYTKSLNLNVEGLRLVCENGMKLSERFVSFTHKHTKGLDLTDIPIKLEKGIEIFNTKIREQFNKMHEVKLSENKAIAFIDNLISLKEEKKEKIMSMKYLELMKKTLMDGGDFDIKGPQSINSYWMLYNLATEVMTHSAISDKKGILYDVQQKQTERMHDLIMQEMQKEITMIA